MPKLSFNWSTVQLPITLPNFFELLPCDPADKYSILGSYCVAKCIKFGSQLYSRGSWDGSSYALSPETNMHLRMIVKQGRLELRIQDEESNFSKLWSINYNTFVCLQIPMYILITQSREGNARFLVIPQEEDSIHLQVFCLTVSENKSQQNLI